MSDAFKRTALGLVGFCPELTQGTPNWKFVANGGSGTTATLDTGGAQHNAALAAMGDDFLNELWIYFKSDTTTSALRGKCYRISDSARSTTTVTLTTPSAMAASPASGDVFYVFAPIKASEVQVTPATENLARTFERQTLDAPSSLKGLKTCSGSFKLELEGLEQENGNGDTPRPDRLSRFLECIGDRRSVAGTTVSGGSSTTTQVDVTSAASLQAGDLVMISGEIRRVTATDTAATPDNITVSPPLSAAPADTTEVFVAETYTPADTGHRSHTMLFLRDTQLTEVRGCVFSVSAEASFGQPAMLSCEFDAGIWDMEDTFTLDGQQSTKKAIPYIQGESHFGTTEICTNSLNFAFGHGRQQLRDTCENSSFYVTSRDSTCQVVFRNKDAVPKETWEGAGTFDYLLCAVGNAAAAAAALCGKAQIQDPASASDVEGHQYWDATFGFKDDQTDYASPTKPVLARF